MANCQEPDILIVTTTVGSSADAQRLARALVQERLAACVQVDAEVRSFYRWEGRLCDEAEHRLVLKTVPDHLPAIEAFFRAHHPYALPQLAAWTAAASAPYADWVRAECAGALTAAAPAQTPGR